MLSSLSQCTQSILRGEVEPSTTASTQNTGFIQLMHTTPTQYITQAQYCQSLRGLKLIISDLRKNYFTPQLHSCYSPLVALPLTTTPS